MRNPSPSSFSPDTFCRVRGALVGPWSERSVTGPRDNLRQGEVWEQGSPEASGQQARQPSCAT